MAYTKQNTPGCSLHRGTRLDRSIRMNRILMNRILIIFTMTVVLLTSAAAFSQEPNQGKVSGDYVVQQSFELGYRFVGVDGNKSMYNTLENLQQGPRLLDFTLSMRSLNHTGTIFDSLFLSNFGYGGDPQSASRLRMSKSKWYDFSATYRRDQNYFDYNLLANPLNPANVFVPNNRSPHFMDTRRNMGDFNLTIAPQAPFRVRLGFTRNDNQGPALSSFHEGTDINLSNDFRNRSDRYQIGVDFKFAPRTSISFDQFYEHNKLDTSMTDAPFRDFVAFNPLAPAVAVPIDIGLVFDPFYSQPCSTPAVAPSLLPTSPVTGNTLTPNLKCNVYFSYNRNSYTRTNVPTSQLSFQSNYWKKLDITAQGGYSSAELKMPVFNEIAYGLVTRTNEVSYQFTGPGKTKRVEGHAELGFTYHFNDQWSLSNQFHWLNWRIPGNWNSNEVACFANTLVGTTIFSPPGSPGGASSCLGVPTVGLPARTASSGADLTAEKFLTFMGEASTFNTATIEWEANKRFAAHLGYRFGNRYLKIKDFTTTIATTFAAPVPVVVTPSPDELATEDITEHTVLLGFHSMPVDGWRLNADLEATQNSNQFTRISPRRLYRFKMRSSYKVSTWASLSGSINDIEGKSDPENFWPANYTPSRHSDHMRDYSLNFTLTPKDWIAVDFGYNYNDLFSTTPSCLPITAGRVPAGPGGPIAFCLNPDATVNTNSVPLVLRYKTDTNSGYFNVMIKPVKRVTLMAGYDLTSDSGFSNWYRGDSQTTEFVVPVDAFGNVNAVGTVAFLPGPNPRAPLGTLGMFWHKPSASIAVEIFKGVTAKGAFNYFDYNEKSFQGPVIPRDFHAKTGTISLKYEF